MDYCETSHGTQIRVLLTDEELQFPALDEFFNKCLNWKKFSKESKDGRKTRSTNRKADLLYDEIMAFEVPPIQLNPLPNPNKLINSSNGSVAATPSSNFDSDSDTSSITRPITRSLRSRSRTPVIQQPQPPSLPTRSTRNQPCTPQNQKIRSHMNSKPPSGASTSSNGSSNVLSAALNQQHPSVSVTKIRQLLRQDSAQKKREEEKARQNRLLMERKVKEERAESQKRQILEERAVKAKEKREQRLNHAAEVRKAREEARQLLKQKEEEKRREQQQILQQQLQLLQINEAKQEAVAAKTKETKPTEQNTQYDQDQPSKNSVKLKHFTGAEVTHNIGATTGCSDNHHKGPETTAAATTTTVATSEVNNITHDVIQPPKSKNVNETFKIPAGVDNIDIIIQDETDDGQSTTEKTNHVATWAKSPYLREALVEQFSRPYDEYIETISKFFTPIRSIADIELSEIFGTSSAVDRRYLVRTSSAVWTPPHRSIKRTSSQLTPSNE